MFFRNISVYDETPRRSFPCKSPSNIETVLKNILSGSQNSPGTLKLALRAMICGEIVSWAWRFSRTPKYSSKMGSAGQKSSRYDKICATGYDLRGNHFSGIGDSSYNDTVLKNALSRSLKPPRYTQIWMQAMICEEIVSWATWAWGFSRTPKYSSKTFSQNPQVHSN